MARIAGQTELRHVARLLKDAGDEGMRRELYSSINRPVKPFRAAVRENIATHMPSGYGPVLAKSFQVKVSQRLAGRAAHITLVGTAKGKGEKRDVAALDDGHLRHPIFGDRGRWALTSVRAGFFSGPGQRMFDAMAREIADALDRIIDKITKG